MYACVLSYNGTVCCQTWKFCNITCDYIYTFLIIIFKGKHQQSTAPFAQIPTYPLDTCIPDLTTKALYMPEKKEKCLGLVVNTSTHKDIVGKPHLSCLLGCCAAELKSQPELMDGSLGWVPLTPLCHPGRVPSPPGTSCPPPALARPREQPPTPWKRGSLLPSARMALNTKGAST